MSSKIDVTGGSYNIGTSADRVGFTPPSQTDLISTDVQDSLVEIYSKTLSRFDAINQQLATLNSNLTALTNRVAALEYTNISIVNDITPASGINPNTFELSGRRRGFVVTFSLVFQFNATPVANQILATGFPSPAQMIQFPCVCVSGTSSGKSARVRISGGDLTDWYSSSGFFATGNTYLV